MLIGGGVAAVAVTLGIWYFFSPKFTDVGYRPVQPVPFSHKIHAGDLGMDCRYCHSKVEESPMANVPPTQTCMNCHKIVKRESEKIKPVKESFETGKPLEWVRVHNLPDYVYFSHAAHLNAGVGCASCHGNVRQMEIVEQKQPLSMSWCLDCHRNPDNHLRPRAELTNMDWTPPKNHAAFVKKQKAAHKIAPSEDCSTCHR